MVVKKQPTGQKSTCPKPVTESPVKTVASWLLVPAWASSAQIR
jgi:hypothetical protein